jgi:hypothetical protein
VKKLFTLLCGTVIAFSFSTATFSQQAPSQKKMNRSAREGRWEGNVVRSNPERSTLTDREIGSTEERIIHYDGMTRCVNQVHGSKKVNQINPNPGQRRGSRDRQRHLGQGCSLRHFNL